MGFWKEVALTKGLQGEDLRILMVLSESHESSLSNVMYELYGFKEKVSDTKTGHMPKEYASKYTNLSRHTSKMKRMGILQVRKERLLAYINDKAREKADEMFSEMVNKGIPRDEIYKKIREAGLLMVVYHPRFTVNMDYRHPDAPIDYDDSAEESIEDET